MPEDPEYLLHHRQKPAVPGEEEMADMVRAAQESGELRHLYGKPLDLSDDSPEWFITRTLKEQGYTHPALERTRELDDQLADAESIVRQLRRRRDSLTAGGRWYSAKEANNFNASRDYELQRYRGKLAEVNRSIRDYNITVPTVLQRSYIPIDRVLEDASAAVPPLEIALQEAESMSRPSRLQSLLRRIKLLRDDGP